MVAAGTGGNKKPTQLTHRKKKPSQLGSKEVSMIEQVSRRVEVLAAHQSHRGDLVKVGEFEISLGGAQYRPLMDLLDYDLVVPFLETGHPALEGLLKPVKAAGGPVIRPYPISDFSGVPDDWTDFLSSVVRELKAGRKVIGFCMGGHGRTGTILASLIAILEPDIEDPITAARSRYCKYAVETRAQAKAVFALKGQLLPTKYGNL